MAILKAQAKQIDKYSFLVWDCTTQQMYDDTGIDLTSNVTAAKIVFKDRKTGTEYEIDVLSRWSYILGDGLTLNILEFPDGMMGDYDYFPDYMYDISVVYTYTGNEYTSTKIIGFRTIISDIVIQQLQQANWLEELKCGCGCKKYASSFRKFDFLKRLGVASDLCLINEYLKILMALYKLTGTTHEYA